MTKSYFLTACRALLAAAGLLLAGPAQAQVSAYTFAAVADTFTPLTAGATNVASIQTDDAISAALPLGFTFQFDGSNYTAVRASSNGILSFSATANNANANSLTGASAVNRPLVAPLWDDLAGNIAASRAGYEVTGTAPNRVFTFEWLNWKWNRVATGANISFQVKLYETTNVVEFVYRPEAAPLVAPTASIGLAGLGVGPGSYLSLSNTTAAPTASSTVENASIGTQPASGQLYRFTPNPNACLAPRNLTVSNISGTGATLSFAGSAAANSYTVTYTPAGGAPTTLTPAPTASPVTLTGLTPGTTYTVRVLSNCASGATSGAATASFATPTYCVDNLGGGSCAATDLISAVSIVGTTLNNTTNNCTTANGSSYATFPAAGSTTATLSSGSGNYSISVTSTANSAIGLWIDYNRNNTFDASEFTQVSAGIRAGVPATAALTVPATAVQGLTRLRIRTRTVGGGPGGGGVTSGDPCTNFTTGQTEDYLVTIGAPAACPTPTGLAATRVTATGAVLSFTGPAAASSYTVTYTPAGGAPTTLVPAPTASPVTLTGLAPGTAYTVTVASACTSGGSVPATVTFTTPALPPANDDCVAALPLPVTADCAAPTAGTVAAATQSLPATAGCGPNGAANDVWYSFTATATSLVLKFSPQFNSIADVRAGTCAASTSLSCAAVPAGNTAGRVISGLTVGNTYLLRVYALAFGGPPPVGGSFTLCLTAAPSAPANDDCASAATLAVTTDCSAPTAGTVAAATQSLPPTAGCGAGGLPAAFDVWYSFTATAASHVLTLNPAFNAVVDLRNGPCATGSSINCGAAPANTTTSRLLTNLVAGTTYLVRVYPLAVVAPLGAGAAFTICLTNAPTLPANDDCAAATVVPVTADCAVPTAGTVAAATQSLAPTANCGGAGIAAANDVWYSFTATATRHTLEAAAQFDGVVDVRSGACATSTSIYCNTVNPNTSRSVNLTPLVVGDTYFVRFYPRTGAPVGASAALQLCVTVPATPPANDDPCGALALPTNAVVPATTAGATTTVLSGGPQPPNCSGANQPKDVWFTLVASGTTASLAFNGNTASMVRVYAATSCTVGFTLVNCLRSTGNGMGLGTVSLTGLTAGRTYYLAVSGFANNSLTGAFTVSNVVLGTRAQANSTALLAFPNPSGTGQVALRREAAGPAAALTLLNALGQVVRQQPWPAGSAEATVPTRGLAPGVYTLRLAQDGSVLTRKLVLE